MWNTVQQWLNNIPIRNQLIRRQALLLQSILIGLILITLSSLPLAVTSLLTFEAKFYSFLTLLLIGCFTFLVLLELRRGRFRFAIMLTSITLLLVLTLFMLQIGVRTDGSLLLAFALPITLAGLLAGRRSLWLVVGASASIVCTIALLENFGVWKPSYVTSTSNIDLAIDFVLVAVLLGLFLDSLSTSLRESLNITLKRERELESIRAALETRTTELETSNQELKHEIAERLRVEAALRESEQRYRLITENSCDLIGLLDGEGRRLYASPSYRTVLGYRPEEFLGLDGASLVHPDDLNTIAEQIKQLTTSGHGRATYRLRHADGTWRWLETEASAITQNGQYYAVTVGRDVTERKHLEAQLAQAQKLESIGRLAGGIAHDFNNILTAIVGNTELAIGAVPPEHPVRADLNEIAQSAERATLLTRQLLAFARKQLIEPRVLDLNQLILNMDKLLQRLIGEDIELATVTAPDLWRVRADRGQIEQVVINLAVNARDAMPNGGKLTIETRNVVHDHDYVNRHISVKPGRYVLLAISDTGTGMDDDIQSQIFEPFFTTKEPGRGTGLGLATCYGIIKQHGGSIWPYSEPGHGSTFKIYLPGVEASVDEVPVSVNSGSLPRGDETILLSEDEPAVRILAARVLRGQGYTVLEAANGSEAIALARDWAGPPIKLLLTDVVMPQMNGKVLAERVKELYHDIKVLFISGYADNAIVHHGRLDPDVVLLEKPFSAPALACKVRAILDG